MKKILSFLVLAALIGSLFYYFSNHENAKQTISVILPMEHEALTQIVNGIKEELDLKNHPEIKLKVMNAQGDANIQRAIIEQCSRQKSNILVPIGTSASQMTLNLAKEQKILCLATDLKLSDKIKNIHATSLNDELSPKDSIYFLHAVLPEIQKITLIFSASEKVAKEIPEVEKTAQCCNIQVQKFMVQNLSELYTISGSIDEQSQAIFILKDHLVVSGIGTLIQVAEKRGIPIIASDEGSVISGGAMAFAVKESSVGLQGACILKQIIAGTPPETIPSQSMKGPFPLFINKEACIKQGLNLDSFIKKTETLGLHIHFVDNTEKRLP